MTKTRGKILEEVNIRQRELSFNKKLDLLKEKIDRNRAEARAEEFYKATKLTYTAMNSLNEKFKYLEERVSGLYKVHQNPKRRKKKSNKS